MTLYEQWRAEPLTGPPCFYCGFHARWGVIDRLLRRSQNFWIGERLRRGEA